MGFVANLARIRGGYFFAIKFAYAPKNAEICPHPGGKLPQGKHYYMRTIRIFCIVAACVLPLCAWASMKRVLASQAAVNLSASDQWIVVDTDIKVTAAVTVGKNVTLDFQGGMIVSSAPTRIVGRGTRVVAPIQQIFGDNVECAGDWAIDRAYPQWFSALDYSYHKNENDHLRDPKRGDDWSVAINKAINMKVTGEVLIPRGHYYIQNPIYVHYGIVLRGESGRRNSPVDQLGKPEDFAFGTFIEPSTAGKNLVSQFNGEYMMYVNKHPTENTWKFNHPQSSMTQVCNLTLSNIYQWGKESVGLKGICCYGGAVFNGIFFYHLYTAIRFEPGVHSLYSDGREIFDCLVHQPDTEPDYDKNVDDMSDSEFLYAFDLPFLGDNTVMQGNHVIHSDHIRALRLGDSSGAVIKGNIFNCDVFISSCHGVDFSANHMEDGAQVKVAKSNVTIRNNFLERGARPSVWIQGGVYGEIGVATLENNSYLNYDYAPRRGGETVEQNRQRLATMSDHDICVGKDCNVTLRNEYRFEAARHGVAVMHTFGVQLLKYDENKKTTAPFTEFNSLSHLLSQECQIAAHTLSHMPIKPLNGGVSLSVYDTNESVQWFGPEKKTYCRYKFEILDTNGATKSATEYSKAYEVTGCSDANMKQKGILINVNSDTDGRRFRVKVVRQMSSSASFGSSTTATAIVPICGTRTLYDNGISICGFKWQK